VAREAGGAGEPDEAAAVSGDIIVSLTPEEARKAMRLAIAASDRATQAEMAICGGVGEEATHSLASKLEQAVINAGGH
jgi:hypothetical protein